MDHRGGVGFLRVVLFGLMQREALQAHDRRLRDVPVRVVGRLGQVAAAATALLRLTLGEAEHPGPLVGVPFGLADEDRPKETTVAVVLVLVDLTRFPAVEAADRDAERPGGGYALSDSRVVERARCKGTASSPRQTWN